MYVAIAGSALKHVNSLLYKFLYIYLAISCFFGDLNRQ